MAEEAKNAGAEAEPTKDVAEEKTVAPAPEESKTVVTVDNAETPAATATATGGSSRDRDAFLTRVVTAKRASFVRAWEESEKAKATNRAARRLASITSWENSKVAEMEAELKKIHEQLEMKKAAQAEKLKNSAAALHRAAEEKRAAAVARRGEEVIAAAEAAARYRARGQEPTRLFGLALFGRGSRTTRRC